MKKLIVKTENGLIEGLHGWDPRIAVFKGVPYARPPVGELRFRSPQPPEPWEGKGNYGIEDQIAALEWTRKNIRAFGGDPDRITIAGQSAGAMSVQCLLTSPKTEGMISGAIVESCIEGDLPGIPVFANPMSESERTISAPIMAARCGLPTTLWPDATGPSRADIMILHGRSAPIGPIL